MAIWTWIGLAFVISLAATGLLRHFAPRLGLVQAPQARSSHTRTTPSGGGLAMVLATLSIAPAFSDQPAMLVSLACATVLGLVGLFDDIWDLAPKLRLAAQGAALLAFGLFALPPVAAALPAFLFALALVAGLWWVNLFNFMDGIDGLAATQALFMLLAGTALSALGQGGLSPAHWPALLLAASVAGFLVWNWPPARIFMGDAGSLFLGMALFALGALAVTSGQLTLVEALILSALFVADATATLLVRLAGGQNVMAAHRSHAYQILSRRLGSHKRATALYLAINLAVVLPLAMLAHVLPAQGFALAIGLVLVLAALALAIGAGRDNG